MLTLQELYDRAVRANPSTYQALRLTEQQSAARQIKDEAGAKAAAAKRAACDRRHLAPGHPLGTLLHRRS